MIRARLKAQLAWKLRGAAKRINALADRLEPLKLSVSNCALVSTLRTGPDYSASKAIADDVIEKARG